MTGDLPLGTPVQFTRTLRRLYRPAAPRSRRLWDASSIWLAENYKGPVGGIIVGARTLSDGECEDGNYDTPTVYHPTRSFPAYLVSWHLRRKPVLVLPDDLTDLRPLQDRVTATLGRPEVQDALPGLGRHRLVSLPVDDLLMALSYEGSDPAEQDQAPAWKAAHARVLSAIYGPTEGDKP